MGEVRRWRLQARPRQHVHQNPGDLRTRDGDPVSRWARPVDVLWDILCLCERERQQESRQGQFVGLIIFEQVHNPHFKSGRVNELTATIYLSSCQRGGWTLDFVRHGGETSSSLSARLAPLAIYVVAANRYSTMLLSSSLCLCAIKKEIKTNKKSGLSMGRSTYTDALCVLLCSINKRDIIKK